MSSLTTIRAAIARTIDTHTSMELFVYALVEDMGMLPAIIVEPVFADFEEAMGRGMDTWDFNIYILTSRAADSANGQQLLDQLVSGAGPNSIRQILYEHADLGLQDTDAAAYALKGYGGSFDWAKVPHVGAVLKVRVRTDGRA
jgi:hypothetical protein